MTVLRSFLGLVYVCTREKVSTVVNVIEKHTFLTEDKPPPIS